MKVTSDLHVHTNLSLCGDPDATVEGYLSACREAGITTIGFSNHCWVGDMPLNCYIADWYRVQTLDRALSLRNQIPDDTKGIKVLVGCETEYIGNGIIGMDKDAAELFDYVLVPMSHFDKPGFVVPADLASGGARAVSELLYRYFYEIVTLGIATGVPHPFVPFGFFDKIPICTMLLIPI